MQKFIKKFCSFILLHVTRVRFINIFALVLFAVFFLLILEIVNEPYIVSQAKLPDFLLQLFWYRVLLLLLWLFNFWLVLHPILRLMSLYTLLMNVELKDFLFDILLFFISIIFSIFVLCVGTVMIEWISGLHVYILDATREVNLIRRLNILLLYGNEEAYRDSLLHPYKTNSSEQNFPKPDIKCFSPVKENSKTTVLPPEASAIGGQKIGGVACPDAVAHDMIDIKKKAELEKHNGKLPFLSDIIFKFRRAVVNVGVFREVATGAEDIETQVGYNGPKVLDGRHHPDELEASIAANEAETNKLKKLALYHKSKGPIERMLSIFYSPHHDANGLTPTGSPIDEEDIAQANKFKWFKPSSWFSSKSTVKVSPEETPLSAPSSGNSPEEGMGSSFNSPLSTPSTRGKIKDEYDTGWWS